MKKAMERTSKKVASKAGAALRDPQASKKSVAASALTQREAAPAFGNFGARMNNALNRIGCYCGNAKISADDAVRIFEAGIAARHCLKRNKK